MSDQHSTEPDTDETVRLIVPNPEDPKKVIVTTADELLLISRLSTAGSGSFVMLGLPDQQVLAVGLHQLAEASRERGDTETMVQANSTLSKLELASQPPSIPGEATFDAILELRRQELFAAAFDMERSRTWDGPEEMVAAILAVAETHGTGLPVEASAYYQTTSPDRPVDGPQTAADAADGQSDPDPAPTAENAKEAFDPDAWRSGALWLEGMEVRHADGWTGVVAEERMQTEKPRKIKVYPNNVGEVGVEVFTADPSDLLPVKDSERG